MLNHTPRRLVLHPFPYIPPLISNHLDSKKTFFKKHLNSMLVIRNLLSWIVVALFLLVAHQYGFIKGTIIAKGVAVVAPYISFVFLILIIVRPLIGIHGPDDLKNHQTDED